MNYLEKAQFIKKKVLGRGIMFTLIVALLIIIVFTIFHTNSVVEIYSSEDFSVKRESRMVFQIRSQLMKAFGACHEAVHTTPNRQEEWAENCLSSIEAALAQVVNEYKSVDAKYLNNELNFIFERAEKIVALSQKPNSHVELNKEINEFDQRVHKLYTFLGEVEASLWGDGAERYSNMIKDFRSAKALELFSVVLILTLSVYLYLLTYFKEKADKDLEAARENLEAQKLTLIQSSKMSALGEMATGIAHEINNPLAVIHTKAEKLRRLSNNDHLTKENLEQNIVIILTMTKRITKIIKGLRVFARDGEADPFVETQIGGIIDETVELCKAKIENASVRLEIAMPNPSLSFECRATQISQVVLNLISNAVDAIEPLQMEDKWVKVVISDLGKFVRISIVDSGAGIPKEAQEKMFAPFYTTKDVGKGTGLGLSISNGIMKAHFGKLQIDQNTPNTSISLIIPKIHQETEFKIGY